MKHWQTLVLSGLIATSLAARGCDTLTVSPGVLEAMVLREDSAAATAAFEAEAAAPSEVAGAADTMVEHAG